MERVPHKSFFSSNFIVVHPNINDLIYWSFSAFMNGDRQEILN